MENSIIATLERKTEISHAAPERFTALRSAAASLSRRNVDLATVELMNEALSRLVMLLYETDSGGMVNVDSLTGKLLIPAPFGKNGHKQWGLKPSEANLLRHILFGWQEQPPALLYYEWTRHSWFLDLAQFGSVGIAKAWLRSHQISVNLYRTARANRLGRT